MLKRLFAPLVEALTETQETNELDRDTAVRKATAVLMVDVALADDVFHERELAQILELVGLRFALDSDEATELVELAQDVASDMVSLYEFTQLLHNSLTADEKVHVVSMLWQVAYADGQLDKHEDSLVLKISDLLHVNRARVMRAKDDARKTLSG